MFSVSNYFLPVWLREGWCCSFFRSDILVTAKSVKDEMPDDLELFEGMTIKSVLVDFENE